MRKSQAPDRAHPPEMLRVVRAPDMQRPNRVLERLCLCLAGDKAAAVAFVESLTTDQSGSGVQSVRAKVRPPS